MSFLVDLHVHTAASDDGLSTLGQQAAAARKAGLHAIAVTDHNQCTPLPGPELYGVRLIPGCEVSTQSGHITGVFLDSPLDLEKLRAQGLPTAAAAVEEIHRQGGIAVLAHPFQSPRAQGGRLDFPIDAIECANARACFKVSDANTKAAALAQSRGLPAVGGSDGHSRQEVGNAYTEIDCTSLELEELKSAILRGRCHPVLVRDTPPFRKGLSQWRKAWRSKSLKKKALALPYLLYCALLSLRPGKGRGR